MKSGSLGSGSLTGTFGECSRKLGQRWCEAEVARASECSSYGGAGSCSGCEMSDERLAYPLAEAAAMLGGISIRSVQRLVAVGALPSLRVLRRVLIPAGALRAFVAAGSHLADNPERAESVAWKESKPCHTDERTRRIGGSSIPTQAANELTGLLAQLTAGKRKPSKRSGGLKRIK